jgi:hypothetical protein
MADDQSTSGPGHIVEGPRWVTDIELVSGWGFKPEALETLFGEPIPGPDGQPSWLLNHILHVDQTVIKPAAALLESSLQLVDLADHFDDLDVGSGIDWKRKSRPNPAQAREMLDALAKSES